MAQSAEFVKGMYEDFGRGNVQAVLDRFDSDIEWREAEGGPYADLNPYTSPQAVAEGLFQRLGSDIEDFTVNPANFIDAGDTIVVEGRYKGTMKATDAPIDAQFAHVWELRNGKVVRFQQYTDTRQWTEAAG